ncbi:MAG: methyl viologen-reducing hydrogenase [Candidatus Bathyarchaeia archaeon]
MKAVPVKVVEEWLNMCGGCECSILDIGEPLLDLLPQLEFVHMPVLMDHKYFGQTGEGKKIEIPEADVGIITGGVRNEEHKELAQEVRNKCKTVIAYGSCAVFGGLPALANMYTQEQTFNKVYKNTRSTVPGDFPSINIPPWTDRLMAVDEVIKVDLKIPGCAPNPDLFVDALTALLTGKEFKLEEKAVCEDCPLEREKKAITSIKRPLEVPPLEERCLLEQGYLCLGPATRTGCGGHEKVPRCIAGNFPCRGCMGPIRFGGNQMVDLMGALATIGINVREIPDRLATFNRFVGGHNKLRVRKV